jgi:hypothetical protein
LPGVRERPPVRGTGYIGFVDPSGGSSDSMVLAICHRERDGRVVLDLVRERKPPFSPEAVVAEFCETLKAIHRLFGDHYAGEFAREPFRLRGINYQLADKPKSDLYRDALPLMNSGKVQLLDLPRLVLQLTQLERRVSRAGKDSIDHPPGAHDDLANAVCGAVVTAVSGPWQLKISDEVLRRFSVPSCPAAFLQPGYVNRVRY